jgi:hypothetical protein
MKTKSGHDVEEKVVYVVEYNNGKSHGLAWINPNHCDGKYVDILCYSGGVTYQEISEVTFIKKYR